MGAPPVQVQVHPAERGRRGGVVLYGTCCCCCCCCCLHTIGGVVGAILGSIPSDPVASERRWVPPSPLSSDVLAEFDPSKPLRNAEEHISAALPEPVPSPQSEVPATPALGSSSSQNPDAERGMSGVALYWLVLLILMPVTVILGATAFSDPFRPMDVGSGFWTLLLGLPAVQLIASMVSSLLVWLWPPVQRRKQWSGIQRITAYAILGTVVGGLLTYMMCGVVGVLPR